MLETTHVIDAKEALQQAHDHAEAFVNSALAKIDQRLPSWLEKITDALDTRIQPIKFPVRKDDIGSNMTNEELLNRHALSFDNKDHAGVALCRAEIERRFQFIGQVARGRDVILTLVNTARTVSDNLQGNLSGTNWADCNIRELRDAANEVTSILLGHTAKTYCHCKRAYKTGNADCVHHGFQTPESAAAISCSVFDVNNPHGYEAAKRDASKTM